MDNLNKSGENHPQMQQTNSITLLKNPQKFKQVFQQIVKISSHSLKMQQYERALKALTKSADMLDVGKNILKDYISKYWKLCINANLACAYQGTWKMQKCNKYCEKVQEQLLKLLQVCESKQNFLNLHRFLIRLRFQHCAILSQLNHHQKALQLCKSTLNCLKTYIQAILEYTQQLTKNQQINSRSSQTIQFSRQVTQFAQQILRNLIKNLTEPLALNNNTNFYYWQKNPQNNEDQVKKKFAKNKIPQQNKRSILGVNKMTHWIDQFNIGTIMHMSQLTIRDFQNCLPIEQYIFKDKLYESVIYCSVAHFTIATQMRFIQSNKDKQNSQENSVAEKDRDQVVNASALIDNTLVSPRINSIIKKYGFKEKSQMVLMSELHHQRAIQIIAQNIKSTVPYLSHLIKSYQKHYIERKQLQPVIAIQQQSLISVSSLKFKNKQQEKHQKQEEQQNYFLVNSDNQNRQIKIYDHKNLLQPGYQDLFSLQNAKILQTRKLTKKLSTLQNQHLDYFIPKIKRNQSEARLIKTARDKVKQLYKNEQTNKKLKKVKSKEKDKKFKQKIGKSPGLIKQSHEGKQTKTKSKKKDDNYQRQVRIKHQSCTQIKVVFKKKK